MLYGLGCGFLVWLIRTFGSYPEGVAFAVLMMNAASPLIDYYMRPNVFGRRPAVEKSS
jgi:electron transport complex protein RnfD